MKKTVIIGIVGFICAIGIFTGVFVLLLPKSPQKPETPLVSSAATSTPNPQPQTSSEPKSPQQPPVKPPETSTSPTDSTFKIDAFVASNEEALGILNMKSEARDQQYILKLLTKKEVFVVAQGTKARVLDRDATTARIEILDGDMKGRRGIVPLEFIQDTKSD